MEELLTIIGRLYVELNNMQKYIENLQSQIKDKDKKITEIQNKNMNE